MKNTDTQITAVAHRLSILYINYDKNYIEQMSGGSYITHINDGTYLGIGYVEEHLAGNRTFGIREEKAAKVMVFDIDEDNLKAVKGIIAILQEYGVPENSIHVSLSGGKGYHVSCFFDRPMELNQLNLFQSCVMVKLSDKYPEMVDLKVDLRPTPTYGIKMPLGIHRVTESRCWFCEKGNMKPIESYEYIHNIEQMSRDYFTGVVMKTLSRENSRSSLVQRAINRSVHYGFAVSKKEHDDESAEGILARRLLCPNTRHITLFDMCLRLKSVGVCASECELLLKAWMTAQDTNMYETPLPQCMTDISEIVTYIFKENRDEKRNIAVKEYYGKCDGKLTLTNDEVRFILSLSNSKMWSVVLFILKYHKDGPIYSERWQAHAISTLINECSGDGIPMQAKTARDYLRRLSDLGFIKVNTVKLSKGENPQAEAGKNNVPQNYYYCRFGNCPTEIAVQRKFVKGMLGSGDDAYVVETQDKTYREILLEAVNYFGLREELFYSMSRRNFKNLFGNNRKVA